MSTDAVPTHPAFQARNPFRAADWRWQRAQWLIDNGRNFSSKRDDGETGQAVQYLRTLARRRRAPRAGFLGRFGDIHTARQLAEGGGVTKLVVQARLLARQTSGEIAHLTAVPPHTVDAYEAVFFNVRDRIDARDWIVVQAIGAWACDQTEPKSAVVLRSFAYFGGPMVLCKVLPYLMGTKDLFDTTIDLSTPEGRREQSVRLVVAAQLLPNDAATDNKLQKIMLILLERERQRSVPSAPTALLAEKIDFRLSELPSGAFGEHIDSAQSPAREACAAGRRQTA